MASLANAIHSFQSGSLSHNEFLAQVDRVLAVDRANSTRQLEEILSEEHTRVMLPPEVYAELRRRVEHLTASKSGVAADPTRSQPDSHSSSLPQSWPGGDLATDTERIKGVGDTLNGRFVLEECVGFGGMGTVYKALDLRKLEASDRKPYIAIKVLNLQFRGHPKSLITLQREARKAQQLAHPNIVSVYDFDRDGSTVYLTMEYLSGKPLSRTLRAPGFAGMPLPEALRIVNGMGKALAYAHERGFVHCDFKPANVILTDKGEVKVIDFGIARVFRKPEEDAEATVFDPGSLGGLTPAYASPEMIEHLDPDPRDDIYALACITYELLTGRHPFDRYPATHARAAGMKLLRPNNLGYRQWKALKAALSFERESRTPDVASFLREMNGERRPLAYAALAGAGLVMAALVAAMFSYFRELPPAPGDEQAVSGSVPAPAPKTAQETPSAAAPTKPALSLAAVTPLLARVPCSALLPAVRDHTLQLHGYLPRDVSAARVKSMLSEVPGLESVDLDVQQVSDDKCDVLKTFAPYWTRNRQAGGGASIHAKAAHAELTEGDYLIVNITTPGYDSYVHIDYYQLDGNVVHLVPSPQAKANQAPANYAATIGDLGNWVIAKPFGTEMIVLLVSPVPLFDGLRPENESRSVYLRAIEQRIGQVAGKYGPEKIAADFVQITTKARKP